jgi:hypothetical protein
MNHVPHLAMRFTKLGKTNASVCDRIGGSPNAWSDDAPWPCCKFCHEPMRFVIQLLTAHRGGRVLLGKASAVQLFVCQSLETCELYLPKAHCAAVRHEPLLERLVHRDGPPDLVDEDRSSVLRVARGIRYVEGTDDREALEDFENDRFDQAMDRSAVSKLFGVPCAGNEPKTPKCRGCRKTMKFLGQIMSVNDWFEYFLHSCAACERVTFTALR